jgi:hypothetical protein
MAENAAPKDENISSLVPSPDAVAPILIGDTMPLDTKLNRIILSNNNTNLFLGRRFLLSA